MAHVHKYKRFTTGKGKYIWRCMIPLCTHALYQPELIIGRPHSCWMCGKVITINQLTSQQTRPVCEDCKEERKERKEKLRKIS